MAAKADIQATRVAGTATSTVVIASPVRLKGLIIASDGGGAGQVSLNTGSSSGGTNLFTADVPSGDVINFSLPVLISLIVSKTFLSINISGISLCG